MARQNLTLVVSYSFYDFLLRITEFGINFFHEFIISFHVVIKKILFDFFCGCFLSLEIHCHTLLQILPFIKQFFLNSVHGNIDLGLHYILCILFLFVHLFCHLRMLLNFGLINQSPHLVVQRSLSLMPLVVEHLFQHC